MQFSKEAVTHLKLLSYENILNLRSRISRFNIFIFVSVSDERGKSVRQILVSGLRDGQCQLLI